jgi:molecular chaperone GrpE
VSDPGQSGPVRPDRRENEGEPEQHGPTVRDRRRIDPETYQVREPQATAASAPGDRPETEDVTEPQVNAQAAEVAQAQAALAERTGDLQRLQAEYINYKRRVDRDRDVTRKAGIESVLKDFLPVLDDLRSAREHGELSGGFKAVADEVERVAGKYGLEAFGQPGDAFDPHIHEALLHAHATGITGPTCVEILQSGYRIGDKVLRPARVAVAEPGPDQVADDDLSTLTTEATTVDGDGQSTGQPEEPAPTADGSTDK